MKLAAQAIEVPLQCRQIDVQLAPKPEDREVVCVLGRRLHLAALIAEGFAIGQGTAHDQQAALTDWGSAVCIGNRRTGGAHHAEKDDPQPQDLVEFGLMKLKPCRISVSS